MRKAKIKTWMMIVLSCLISGLWGCSEESPRSPATKPITATVSARPSPAPLPATQSALTKEQEEELDATVWLRSLFEALSINEQRASAGHEPRLSPEAWEAKFKQLRERTYTELGKLPLLYELETFYADDIGIVTIERKAKDKKLNPNRDASIPLSEGELHRLHDLVKRQRQALEDMKKPEDPFALMIYEREIQRMKLLQQAVTDEFTKRGMLTASWMKR